MTGATTIAVAHKPQPLVDGYVGVGATPAVVRIEVERGNAGEVRIGDDANVTTSPDGPVGRVLSPSREAVVRLAGQALGSIIIAGAVAGDRLTWTSS